MSILSSAGRVSVDRGYDYYKKNKVLSSVQLNESEYEGIVEGSNKNAYSVKINKAKTKKSQCSCPFANGNTICKHMVALYFITSPDEALEYEEWLNNKYEEIDDYYDDNEEIDDYYDDNEYSSFVRPLDFDELLNKYISKLTESEAKKILIKELQNNEKLTFCNYLQKEYKLLISSNEIYGLLEKLHKRLSKLAHDYNYNYKDYSVVLLKQNEKSKLFSFYEDKMFVKKIDKILLNPELATYNQYDFVSKFYRDLNDKNKIAFYLNNLKSFFDTLKHYSIKNEVPKSNVLINISILGDYSTLQLADSLIKNAKYKTYINYIIKNNININELYDLFKEKVQKNINYNKNLIPDIFLEFYFKTNRNDIYLEYLFYEFIYNNNDKGLKYIKNTDPIYFEKFVKRIENSTKDVNCLEKLYIFLEDEKNLFKILYDNGNDNKLIEDIDYLKNYSNELYQYFEDKVYEILEKDIGRKVYQEASIYAKAIYKLKDKYFTDFMFKLRRSKHSKKGTLFDEINICLSLKDYI